MPVGGEEEGCKGEGRKATNPSTSWRVWTGVLHLVQEAVSPMQLSHRLTIPYSPDVMMMMFIGTETLVTGEKVGWMNWEHFYLSRVAETWRNLF